MKKKGYGRGSVENHNFLEVKNKTFNLYMNKPTAYTQLASGGFLRTFSISTK